jgi:hypothetical protein
MDALAFREMGRDREMLGSRSGTPHGKKVSVAVREVMPAEDGVTAVLVSGAANQEPSGALFIQP